MPLSLVPELSRLENDEGVRSHDLDIARKVDALSKIVLPSSAQVWLVNLAHFSVTKLFTIMEEGPGLDEVEQTFRESLHNLFETMEQKNDWQEHNESVEALVATRSRKRAAETEDEQSEAILNNPCARRDNKVEIHGRQTDGCANLRTRETLMEAIPKRTSTSIRTYGFMGWITAGP